MTQKQKRVLKTGYEKKLDGDIWNDTLTSTIDTKNAITVYWSWEIKSTAVKMGKQKIHGPEWQEQQKAIQQKPQ